MGDLPNLAKLDYASRINRAIDYITANLAQPIQLADVARAACFSPFHFHRIFRGTVGETLNAFINRIRLERALFLMAHRGGASLTDIALACGFSSSSDFSRSFRKRFGVSPRAYDLEGHRHRHRENLNLPRLQHGANPDGFDVRLRRLPERRVAYLRVLRPFEPGRVQAAAQRLLAWATDHDLAGGQWLGYMWEDPEIVPLGQCRYDVGVVIAKPIDPVDGIGVTTFPSMTVAEIAIAGSIELEQRALDFLYLNWLPDSGYAPAHQPAFEAWNGAPFQHGDSYFELAVQLPVIDAATPL